MENKDSEFQTKAELEEKRKFIKTFDDLIGFLSDVKDNYNCGYAVEPRAIAQACLATAWYFAHEFGITGFQAGFVMWDFITGWEKTGNKTGLRLIDYDDMLYPQYEHKFGKSISSRTWENIQKAAKELIEKNPGGGSIHPNVYKHWQSIADGNVPFGYSVSD